VREATVEKKGRRGKNSRLGLECILIPASFCAWPHHSENITKLCSISPFLKYSPYCFVTAAGLGTESAYAPVIAVRHRYDSLSWKIHNASIIIDDLGMLALSNSEFQ